MNRKKLIPLLLFLLLLLLFVCVWSHSGNIVKNRAISALPKQDIDFNFVKKANTLELRGHFASEKSVQTLHTAMGNRTFNNLSNINASLLAKEGVVSLTQKLLLRFNEHYKEGSIVYANGTLTVEGVVEDEAYKDAIDDLLAHSSIASKNNTRVVPPLPTAEELAAIKAKKEAEEKRKAQEAQAQLEAKKLEEEKAKALAQKEAEEKQKAQEAEAQAQLEAKKLVEEKAKALALKEAEEKRKAQEAEAQAQLEAKKLAEKKEAEKKEANEKRKLLEAKMQEIIETEHITFELNRATLTEKSIDTVSHIATILQENPQINVEIGGHTDSLGDDDYNLNLSQKRVNAVKEKLMSMEIDEHRLKAVGYGETHPVVSNDTKENRRKNRRVEFKILGE